MATGAGAASGAGVGVGSMGIPAGIQLQLDPFEGVTARPITVSSTVPFDNGASAYVLPGRIKGDSGRNLDVALKVFPTILSVHNRELLRRELQVCRKFRHPLLLPFLGTSSYGLHTILVSYYMKNGNLRDYLVRHPDSNRRRFVFQVAQGVQFLHETAKYVHGDLKCHNILVSDNETALLADFGLSTAVEKAASDATTATDIRQRHSLRFAAPEILLGAEPAEIDEHSCLSLASEQRVRMRSKTPASDVYAFGMVILEIFTETRPWGTVNDVSVIVRVMQKETPPLPSQRVFERGFTTQYWDLCQFCWSFHPEDRPIMNSVVLRLRLLGGVGPSEDNPGPPVEGQRPAPDATQSSSRTVNPSNSSQKAMPRRNSSSTSADSVTRSIGFHSGENRSLSTAPSSIPSHISARPGTRTRAASLRSLLLGKRQASPATPQSLRTPTQGWDSLYLSVLRRRDSTRLRNLLDRSELEVVMPQIGVVPLSQAVVLTLSHQIAQEISDMSPLDSFFKQAVLWITRCVTTLDVKNPLAAPYSATVLSKVLTQLSMTKPSIDILPSCYPEASEVPRMISRLEALVQQKIDMIGA